MITIKYWCLPNVSQEILEHIYNSTVQHVQLTDELPYEKPEDLLVLMPSDLMHQGLGEEILIEISGVKEDPFWKRDPRVVFAGFAKKLVALVISQFPKAKKVLSRTWYAGFNDGVFVLEV